MARYKLEEDGTIYDSVDKLSIPPTENNWHYRKFLEWSGTPDAYVAPTKDVSEDDDILDWVVDTLAARKGVTLPPKLEVIRTKRKLRRQGR